LRLVRLSSVHIVLFRGMATKLPTSSYPCAVQQQLRRLQALFEVGERDNGVVEAHSPSVLSLMRSHVGDVGWKRVVEQDGGACGISLARVWFRLGTVSVRERGVSN
jgi:hypothetical protein